jgi:hypothetical protein
VFVKVYIITLVVLDAIFFPGPEKSPQQNLQSAETIFVIENMPWREMILEKGTR